MRKPQQKYYTSSTLLSAFSSFFLFSFRLHLESTNYRFTKYPCFIWIVANIGLEKSLAFEGKYGGRKTSWTMISRENILLPPFLITLGLMKQFIKALDKTGDCFKYVCQKFPVLSKEKFKAGIFDGPQIHTLWKTLYL